MKRTFKDSVSIVLAGEAGQGIQSIESMLTGLLKKSGFNVFATKEYMSRVRGGSNSTTIRVSSSPVSGYSDGADILIPLTRESIARLQDRITPGTVVIGEKETVGREGMLDVPMTKIAAEIGNKLYSSAVAAGLVCGLLKTGVENCVSFIRGYFGGKGESVVEGNARAVRAGYTLGTEMSGAVEVFIKKNGSIADDIMITGSEALAMGALAGGCNYVCAYPMSPSTGVLERMAAYSRKMDIIVEQVEDEVGVINMALGAWYAGARALVTTSGGGFSLMAEGISLAGMIESPLVVHLAQRPGPATGLPTRTEQGDLDLALYAGHGEFPRVILAPGSLQQGYDLAAKAFGIAEKCQVPVFILTDQFFVDSFYNTPAFSAPRHPPVSQTVRTAEGYQRFQITSSGLSPRGVPGFGTGPVRADSDEHDENGFITESAEVRTAMVDKRLRKMDLVRRETVQPGLYGPKDYTKLAVCWGSTLQTALEALENINDPLLALAHFPWVYPLPEETGPMLKRAGRLILVENNPTGQFGELVRLKTGIGIRDRVLKYDGRPFSVNEMAAGIKKYL